jgi:hypothetical protein
MKKVRLDTWIQLLGMLGLLGGLVFVGVEMQQNQRIAVAGPQLGRSTLFGYMLNAFSKAGGDLQSPY